MCFDVFCSFVRQLNWLSFSLLDSSQRWRFLDHCRLVHCRRLCLTITSLHKSSHIWASQRHHHRHARCDQVAALLCQSCPRPCLLRLRAKALHTNMQPILLCLALCSWFDPRRLRFAFGWSMNSPTSLAFIIFPTPSRDRILWGESLVPGYFGFTWAYHSLSSSIHALSAVFHFPWCANVYNVQVPRTLPSFVGCKKHRTPKYLIEGLRIGKLAETWFLLEATPMQLQNPSALRTSDLQRVIGRWACFSILGYPLSKLPVIASGSFRLLIFSSWPRCPPISWNLFVFACCTTSASL